MTTDVARMTDVLAVGEAMVMLTAPSGSVADAPRLNADVGGAEVNVACFLAASGHRAAWFGAVGADPHGARVLAHVTSYGVDTRWVRRDAHAPTGLYTKEATPDGATRVWYHRRGSAASRMDASDAGVLEQCAPRVLHLSGITPALSPSAARLCSALIVKARTDGVIVSFDVNFRPGLWSARRAAGTLAHLARCADIVFVGRDEAATLWGTTTAEDAARATGAAHVIVKDADIGATAFREHASVFVAAPSATVVEPVGAGDAFAAGYLTALLRDSPEEGRLLAGHTFAGLALASHRDVPPAAVIRAAAAAIDARVP